MTVCGVYTENFARKDILDRHVKCVHGGQKFEGTVCLKSFSRKYNLNEHTKNAYGDARRESVISFAPSYNVPALRLYNARPLALIRSIYGATRRS